MLDESKRQRSMRHEVRISRQALDVVRPVNEKIDSWQRNAARLVALGRRARIYGGRDEDLRQETKELLAAVRAEMRSLSEVVQDLPPAVAGNGRVLDTQRAMASIADELERALTLFDDEQRAAVRAEAFLVPEPEYLETGR